MQPYNPMYNSYGSLYGGQPLSNPMVGYQERMAQLQQQYNMPQQYAQPLSGLLGKVVDSVEVVRATDIPMDGNCYYFPKADGSEVYAKRWLPNGTTEVLVYKPSTEQVVTQEHSTDVQTFYDTIASKLDGIDERIGKIEKTLGTRTAVNRTSKKEDGE